MGPVTCLRFLTMPIFDALYLQIIILKNTPILHFLSCKLEKAKVHLHSRSMHSTNFCSRKKVIAFIVCLLNFGQKAFKHRKFNYHVLLLDKKAKCFHGVCRVPEVKCVLHAFSYAQGSGISAASLLKED